MNRLTPDLIRKYNPTISTLAVTLALVDERKLKFRATCNVMGPNIANQATGAPEMQVLEIADTSGKVRTWSDVDALIRAMGKALPTLTGTTYSIDMARLVPTYSDTLTPADIGRKQHASIVKALRAQNKRVSDTTAALAAVAAFETGTPSQQGVWREAKNRQTIALEQQQWLIAERDRLAGEFSIIS